MKVYPVLLKVTQIPLTFLEENWVVVLWWGERRGDKGLNKYGNLLYFNADHAV